MINSSIKNIIFDLGGVILNIDYQLASNEFQNLGIQNFDELYSQAKQNNLFDELETGKISPESFRNEIRKMSGLDISDTDLDNAWNAMLLDLPKERIDLLFELSKKYRIFLLSNTNIIHFKNFNYAIINSLGEDVFLKIFEKVYYSFEIGFRKPNADCFQFVLDDAKLKSHETLFIDDSIQHINAAEKLGIQTIHLTNGNTINKIFINS